MCVGGGKVGFSKTQGGWMIIFWSQSGLSLGDLKCFIFRIDCPWSQGFFQISLGWDSKLNLNPAAPVDCRPVHEQQTQTQGWGSPVPIPSSSP